MTTSPSAVDSSIPLRAGAVTAARLRRDAHLAKGPATEHAAAPLLVARAIHKHFRHDGTETAVLAGAEMSLYRGELVAMIGPSGCGKSTLLNILCGLVAADSGAIEMAPSLRGHIGYMQQYDSLLPWQTVLENCIMPLRLHAVAASFAFRRRSEERHAQEATGRALLRELDLEQYAEHYPHQLSGGMRQKVSCARAIITVPPLLLLDEPFRSLDGITKTEMHDWYRRRVMGGGADTGGHTGGGASSSHADRGGGAKAAQAHGTDAARDDRTTAGPNQTTTLLVTHDIHEAAQLADRVLICSARPMRICAVIPAPLLLQATASAQRGGGGSADATSARHRRDEYAHTLAEALRATGRAPS